jgi:hypothetical protein
MNISKQGGSVSMIVQQCEECAKKSKKAYCNRCILRADYFHIQGYGSRHIEGKSNGNWLELITKAYTWNDVIEYIRNTFFGNCSRAELNINCEKDFAYIEENLDVQDKTDGPLNNILESRKMNLIGFKVYLIDRDNPVQSQVVNNQNLYDLTNT